MINRCSGPFVAEIAPFQERRLDGDANANLGQKQANE
jgi:hypothetical protein